MPIPRQYTRAELVRILQEVAKRNGGRPMSWRTYDRLRDRNHPCGNTMRRPYYFGTWQEALKVAGLPATKRQPAA